MLMLVDCDGVIQCRHRYVPSTFFFFSGYFVPASVDKKGIRAFLGDRVKRLGLPFVFFNHVLGPIWLSFIQAPSLGVTPAFQDYLIPLGGPTWYVSDLFFFLKKDCTIFM
jgi:glucans biosynthesis protein C